jgi:tetratricopeptide (TPR) repeat protein
MEGPPESFTVSSPRLRYAVCLILLAWASLATSLAAESDTEQIARAQELLDAGEAKAAIKLLNRAVKAKPPNAQAHLLRSTAHFVLGDVGAGRRDLDRALEIDPTMRQAWLNRAALDLSEGEFEAALVALREAKRLDPMAPDNDLNIGAVLLLQGELEGASKEFASYLQHHSESADAHYLVASNYAMAGYAGPTIEHLKRAIQLDETIRVQARTDPNFKELESNLRYQDLLLNDNYRPPAGYYTAVQGFEVPYEGPEGLLLRAVLDALQLSGQPFDPRVEATPGWALIRGEMRMKVTNGENGAGLVQVSAPPDRFTPSEWRRRTEDLYRQITVRLASRRF